MGTVTGYSAARMKQIEDSTVVGGHIDAFGNLILETRDGQYLLGGHVAGEPGAPGVQGPPGVVDQETLGDINDRLDENSEALNDLGIKARAPLNLILLQNSAFFLEDNRVLTRVYFMWNTVVSDENGNPIEVAEYEVWARHGNHPTGPYRRTPEAEILIEGWTPGVTQYVAVRARAKGSTEWSDLSEELAIIPVFPGYVDIPPTIPTLASDKGVIYPYWDGLFEEGVQPSGFQHLLTEKSIEGSDIWDTMATPSTEPGQTTVIRANVGDHISVRFRWVDVLGRVSEPSDSATIEVVGISKVDLTEEVAEAIDKAVDDSATALASLQDTVASVVIEYAVNSSESVAPVTGWSTDSPERTPGSFIWTRTTIAYVNGSSEISSPALLTGNAGATGSSGTPGRGMQSTLTTYQVGTSGTVAPSGTWLISPAATTAGQFLWTRTVITWTDSTTSTAYSVAAHGATGEQGSQGIQGPAGADGTPRYTWLKYADTPTTGMSDDPAGKIYMGIAYNKTSSTESNNYADYSWSLIQGPQGNTGSTGKGISSTVVTYQVHSNGTTAPTGTWQSSPQATTVGQFLWTRTITTYTDSTNSTAYSVSAHGSTGATGAAGKGISSTAVTYQVHTNGTTAPVGTWHSTPQVTSTGQFLWVRTVITYTDTSTSTAYAVSAHGATGAQGIQGPAGDDGEPTYTWIKYGTSAAGAGMSDDPAGKTYIGIAYNKLTPTESNTPGDYTWSLFQGPQGPQGNQGIQGPAGADGTERYTWLKYADSPTTGMSDSPTGKTYMGIAYNKTTATESTNYADYAWSLIQGPQGNTGSTGAAGKGISSTAVTYQVHTNGTTAPTGSWVANPPATTSGQFLWTRTITTYTDATNSTAYSVAAHGATGSTGATGKGISSTAVTYQVHSNGTTAPTGTWQTSPQTTSTGQYLWTRTITTYTDATTTTGYSVAAHGATGAQGIQGPIGPNGQPTYTWIKYGTSAAGAGMSDDPAGKTYIGIAYNKTTATESTTASDYAWSLIQGPQGNTGNTGAAGVSATNVVVGNDAVAIPTNVSGATTAAHALVIPFGGWIGNTRTAATVAVSGLPTGITAGTNTAATTSADGSLTLNVASGSTLGGGVNGDITLTFTANGQTFVRKFSWAKARTGATGAAGSTGAAGTSATSVDVGNEAVVIPTNASGATTAASSIVIPFTGFIGSARAAATVAVSGLPTGITVTSNVAGTTSAAGTLTLAVANASTLGGGTTGSITLTVTVNSIAFARTFTWTKGVAGATGSTGSTGSTGATGKGVSSVTPYFLTVGAGSAAPAKPTANPPGGSWSLTEPGYISSTDLYRTELIVYTDATFAYTNVTKVSAFTAATAAVTAANLADAKAAGMVKASATDPGHQLGRIWIVLNGSGQMIGIKISNGSTWASYLIVADQILVPSSVGTVSIANGAVTASRISIVDFENYFPDPTWSDPGYVWTTWTKTANVGIQKVGTGAQSGGYVAATDIPVKPGEKFRFKATRTNVVGTVGEASLYVQRLNSAKSVVGSTRVLNLSAAGTFENLFEVPAGISYIRLGFYTEPNMTSATTVRISDVEIRRMVGTLIEPDAVTAQMLKASQIWADEAWLNVLRAGVIETTMVTPSFGNTLNLSANHDVTIIAGQVSSQNDSLNSLADDLDDISDTLESVGSTASDALGTANTADTKATEAKTAAAAASTSLTSMQQVYSFTSAGAVISAPGSAFNFIIQNTGAKITENNVTQSEWTAGKFIVKSIQIPDEEGANIEFPYHKIERYNQGGVVGTIVRAL